MTTAWQTFRASRFRSLVWVVPLVAVLVAAAIIISRVFLDSDTGQSFLASYPGESPAAGAPSDSPWWLEWQHGLNFFIIILLIRSGWMIHSQRQPEAYWTRRNTGFLKTKGQPERMSLYKWLHLVLDVLWSVNGVIFIIALFITSGWKRVVPTSWDVFANAGSAGLQYVSLYWPTSHPWADYNSLQVLAYFVTIFIAAPLAAITGIRMSPIWRNQWKLSKIYPVQLARAIHLPVMFYFCVFIIVHVTLVFTTGMRRNLNYMYSWKDSAGADSWWGFIIFFIVLLVVVIGWLWARPLFMQPVASASGKVTSR